MSGWIVLGDSDRKGSGAEQRSSSSLRSCCCPACIPRETRTARRTEPTRGQLPPPLRLLYRARFKPRFDKTPRW